jgi:hypothetical protein
VADSGGVQVVRNGVAPRGGECGVIPATPVAEIRSGPDARPAGSALYRVRGAARLSNGDVVVLNGGTQELLYYSADGMFRRSLGRSGDGPGEFRTPVWLWRGDADTLFVWDDGLLRLSTFVGDAFLESRQVSDPAAGAPPMSIRGRFDDGSFLLVPGPLVWVGGAPGVGRSPLVYRRFDPRTGRINDLATGWGMETVVEDGAAYVLPFGKSEVALARGSSLVVADNGAPAMRVFDLRGRLVQVIEWSAPPVPVTAPDRREFARRAGRWLPPDAADGEGRFAAVRPRFATILADRTGRLWVREYASFAEPAAGWLVFEQPGVLTCRVAMPDRAVIWETGQDYLIGVRADSLGEESVVVLALTVGHRPERGRR